MDIARHEGKGRELHSSPFTLHSSLLLGLGANLGDPVRQLGEAVRRLSELIEIDRVSSVYLTEPVGNPDQPTFFNAVARARTGLAPSALLRDIRRIEAEMGRFRGIPNAPRTIDIDILTYADRVIDTPELVVPHPRMHLRAFVLVPLAEIAPDWRHPTLAMTPAELQRAAGRLERIELWGTL